MIMTGGCDSRPGQVKDTMNRLSTAVDQKDGQTVATLYTQSTADHYGELVGLARAGTREEVARLPISDRGLLLLIRHRFTPTELTTMDGRTCIRLMAERGWWGIDMGEEEYGRIKVTGSTAWLEVKEPDRRVTRAGRRWLDDNRRAYNVRFYNEDGGWRMDETSLYDLWNEMLLREVKMSGMMQDEYLIASEEESSEKPVPKNIWERPKR